MKKKVLYVIIAFICISLAGIVAVQYFWINNAIQVKEAQFNRSVNEALGAVVNKLETREDIVYLKKNLVGDSIHALVQAFSKDPILALNDKLDSLLRRDEDIRPPFPQHRPPFPEMFFDENLNATFADLDNVIRQYRHIDVFAQDYPNGFTIEWNAEFDGNRLDSIILANRQRIESVRPRSMSPAPEQLKVLRKQQKEMRRKNRMPPPPENSAQLYIEHSRELNRPDPAIFHDDMRIITKKARKIKDVIQKMAREMENKPLPIEKRINRENLEKSLSKALADKDISSPYEYAVITSSPGNNKVPLRSGGFQIDKRNQIHRVSLFPNDIFRKTNTLLLYFPEQKSIVLKSLSGLMLVSVFFTLIIILSSILGIVTMLRQKKISDIKTDFINNMTHEFKTPIATISIAVDSINNAKVIDEPERIKSFTRIIKEENNRMNARVEQVLQMALLDSSEFRLNLKPVDLNALVAKVAGNIRLQVENREGRLELQPGALNSLVEADEIHLSNVIMNLLDNANKYSPGKPEIRVTTTNRGSSVMVTVEDKGMGMNTETQRKIFEKFYRLSTGNIHNVKGFGLGLSYARAIVLAHKGEIKVSSEVGKGSTFEVTLPMKAADELMS
ncbi:MAG TPA: HAMP domain-containing sensor histidine kinase [Bacteroidales bacterium]|nr:HAMP domain-containing sensor histidine kinase [Bacteroidales bacterium]